MSGGEESFRRNLFDRRFAPVWMTFRGLDTWRREVEEGNKN